MAMLCHHIFKNFFSWVYDVLYILSYGRKFFNMTVTGDKTIDNLLALL